MQGSIQVQEQDVTRNYYVGNKTLKLALCTVAFKHKSRMWLILHRKTFQSWGHITSHIIMTRILSSVYVESCITNITYTIHLVDPMLSSDWHSTHHLITSSHLKLSPSYSTLSSIPLTSTPKHSSHSDWFPEGITYLGFITSEKTKVLWDFLYGLLILHCSSMDYLLIPQQYILKSQREREREITFM